MWPISLALPIDRDDLERIMSKPFTAMVEPFQKLDFIDEVSYFKRDLVPIDSSVEPEIIPGYPVITMTQSVFARMLRELTNRPPEAGGLLLGPKDIELVTHFLLDENAAVTPISFTIDHEGLNAKLRGYTQCQLDVKGLVHSHPSGVTVPSRGDLIYVNKLFANPKNESTQEMALPIVCDGRLWTYLVRRKGSGVRLCYAQLLLV